MIDNEFIVTELGITDPYPNDLLEITTKFTMAFYYCEKNFFSRTCYVGGARTYASDILRRVGVDCNHLINNVFLYFKDRYLLFPGASDRLYFLIMENGNSERRDLRVNIENYLSNSEGNFERMLAVCLTVIIRLRHNLLHANKYEAMLSDANDQIELLTNAYDLLADLLLKTNNRSRRTPPATLEN